MKTMTEREQMNVVIVGHVDHGKSTLIGRLLADTGALPQGKLEAVKENCRKTAKPFEYAFLLDALKDEQSQGITIDTARCFFKSEKRDYIIIDAPGHIEFLKNMVSGAARAEAAMLVIDAKEGIRENSKRHGYMLSFLGIKNVVICVNKMDLVDYDEATFQLIKEEYTKFLDDINIKPMSFIPISAREGDAIASLSSNMPWYKGFTVLSAFDEFKKNAPAVKRDLRLPLQDIYKFTAQGDDRRIFAGRIESGTLKVGDEVVFLPSNKKSRVTSIEGFSTLETKEVFAGQSTGVCLDTQIYVRPGEILCKSDETVSHVSTKFKANVFWMGKQPLIKNKNYKLKVATQQVPVVLSEILGVLDASELSSIEGKNQIERHDVAECIFETLKPVAFDQVTANSATGRFVIVDNYEISGGGIILAPVIDDDSSIKQHVRERAYHWERGKITPEKRAKRYSHKSAMVVIAGAINTGKKEFAKAIEEKLYEHKRFVYYFGVPNDIFHKGNERKDKTIARIEYIQQMGETAHVLTDAGLIIITNITDIDNYEMEILKSLNQPAKTIVFNVGDAQLQETHIDLHFQTGGVYPENVQQAISFIEKAIQPDPEFSI